MQLQNGVRWHVQIREDHPAGWRRPDEGWRAVPDVAINGYLTEAEAVAVAQQLAGIGYDAGVFKVHVTLLYAYREQPVLQRVS